MKLKAILALLVVGCVGLVVAKKTHLFSYATTAWRQVAKDAKDAVPTKFEIERLRGEIANLDQDVNTMIRPVAEYKVSIDRLRIEIAKSQANLDDTRKDLLARTDALKEGRTRVVLNNREFDAAQVREKLRGDFELFKRQEANLAARSKVLEAKQAALKASQDQLVKVIQKKREYEVRLAQLEAENETLAAAAVGEGKIQIDNSRATEIDRALTALEDRIKADINVIEMRTHGLIPTNARPQTAPLDLNAIRAHLEGTGSAPAQPEEVSRK